ncbi:hypothetical protein V500_02067 [Pseudogymnoascus sp. VKM F-4518 (FW-2643)]|nr:hypothetical protein V500_02067 [Pseudogymnoascus sp. VKM F-4518 (FW-2643)]
MVTHEVKSHASSMRERDDAQLQRMGKKPALKRNFGLLSILGFSCTILGTWEGLLGTFTGPLRNGGSGGAIYAFIFGWVGTFASFMVLAELASMAPTSGGQYHWAAMLAPPKHMKFISFVTVGGKILPRAGVVLLVMHIVGFFGVLIPLVYMAKHNTKEQVFLSFHNGGGFKTQGLSWFVGMTTCAFAFGGDDAAVHMAEEIANASKVIPQSLMLSVGINGCLGFGILIATMFCTGPDLGGKLGDITGYPYMGIFLEATNSVSGSLVMSAIIFVIYVSAFLGLLATTSRQLGSFSRDRGVPGWRLWSRISASRQLPIPALIASVTIAWLLAMIRIGSDVAMEDIVSMAVSAIYLSYLLVSILLFVRRIRGDISLYNDSEDEIINVPGAKLVWGPFRCPGILGTIVNGYAIIYITIIIFFSFWPSTMDPTIATMNWSVLAIGGAMFFAILYYIFHARHVYTGPIVEVSL